MGIAEASSVPRIHHQWFPDKLLFESGVSPDTLSILSDMGHDISDVDYVIGATQSIQRGSNGTILGAPDPRRPGAGAVPQ